MFLQRFSTTDTKLYCTLRDIFYVVGIANMPTPTSTLVYTYW